jgi:hypothetical protein
MHTKLLQQIVTLIQASPDHIHFHKVRAHAGIAGNEFADLSAKHADLHDHDHLVDVQHVSADGNPYTDMFWLATREVRPGSVRLSALSNLKEKLNHVMQKKHRLGGAKTNTGYYTHWFNIMSKINNSQMPFGTCKHLEQRNVMWY